MTAINRRTKPLWTAILLLPVLAACTVADDVADGQDSDDSVRLRAELLSVTTGSPTRTTTVLESVWADGDHMAVSDANTGRIYDYKVKDAMTGLLVETSEELPNAMLWHKGEITRSLTAWSYGGSYGETLPTDWDAPADQGSVAKLQPADFLYCPPTVAVRNGNEVNGTLTFTHAMARIHVLVRADADAGVTSVSDLKFRVYPTGTFTYDDTYSQPLRWATTGAAVDFTPCPLDATGYVGAFTALVIPQNRSNARLLSFSADNGKTYTYTPATDEAKLEPGMEYLYYVSFTDGNVTITTVELAANWIASGLVQGTIKSKADMPGVATGTWAADGNGKMDTGNNADTGNINSWTGDGSTVTTEGDGSSLGNIGDWVDSELGVTSGTTSGKMPETGTGNWNVDNGGLIDKNNGADTGNANPWTGADSAIGTQTADGSLGNVGDWVDSQIGVTPHTPGGKMPETVVGDYDTDSSGYMDTANRGDAGNTNPWAGKDSAVGVQGDDESIGDVELWKGEDSAITTEGDGSSLGNIGDWVSFSDNVYDILIQGMMPYTTVSNWSVDNAGLIDTANGADTGNANPWTGEQSAVGHQGDSGSIGDAATWTDSEITGASTTAGQMPVTSTGNWNSDSQGKIDTGNTADTGNTNPWTGQNSTVGTQNSSGALGNAATWGNSGLTGSVVIGTP